MHLIVFSHLRWNFVYQRPQHLLSRLARHWRVLFVEEPVPDTRGNWLEVMAPCDGVTVLRPHTNVAGQGFSDQQLPLIADLLRGYMDTHRVVNYVAWLYTPLALPLVDELSPRAVLYDCMDELSAFKDSPAQLREREAALLKRADLVFTGGPGLFDAKRHFNENVICLPSGVDSAHYAVDRTPRDDDAAARAEQLQGAVPQPRLGFFGVIDERLDIELVAALADASPAWNVVMVGPVVKIDPASLPRRGNITWIGQQAYELLPYLVHGWDVCLLPFALNDATRYISPTKTLEYMAADKPVVSTAIADVIRLYGEVVRVGRDIPSFIQLCAEALDETDVQRAHRVQAMRASVAQHSWDAAALRVHDAILQMLNLARPGASNAAAASRRPTSMEQRPQRPTSRGVAHDG
jgi:glycosyltransferase involved in cell wall biosynthesis